jgi:hypothetical protein
MCVIYYWRIHSTLKNRHKHLFLPVQKYVHLLYCLYTDKLVLCYLPSKHWNRVTSDRWLLNTCTGLIKIKCTEVKLRWHTSYCLIEVVTKDRFDCNLIEMVTKDRFDCNLIEVVTKDRFDCSLIEVVTKDRFDCNLIEVVTKDRFD